MIRYLDNVYPSLTAPLPGTVRAKGALHTTKGTSLCLDFMSGSPNAGGSLVAKACSNNRAQQSMHYLDTYQITGVSWPASVLCIETKGINERPFWAPCDRNSARQRWDWTRPAATDTDDEDGAAVAGAVVRLRPDRGANIASDQCLGVDAKSRVVVMSCSSSDVTTWKFDDASWAGRQRASRRPVAGIGDSSALDQRRAVVNEPLSVVPRDSKTSFVALSDQALACSEGKSVDWPVAASGSEVDATLQECADACELAIGCDSFSRSAAAGDCWLKDSGGSLCGLVKLVRAKNSAAGAGAGAGGVVSKADAAKFSPEGCRPKSGYRSYMRAVCRSSAGRMLNLAQRVANSVVVTPRYTGKRYHGNNLGVDSATGKALWLPK